MKRLIQKTKGFCKSASTKVAVVLAAAVPLASNAAIDTTDAVAEITGAGTAIAAVGGAILVLAGISLTYRWVKASFF